MALIPLRDGTFATVDDTLADQLLAMGPWRVSARGYVVRGTRKAGQPYRVIHLSREVLRLSGIEPGEHNDHKHGDKRDNRLCKLRPATPSQNGGNQDKHANNKSGFKGVSWHKKSGKWVAQIKHEGKVMHLGLFSDVVDAAHKYDTTAIEFKGEFARTNFPVESDV